MRTRLFISTVLVLSAAAPLARADDTPATTDAPYVVGAVGDSITAGFDAVRLGDNREFSWATGDSALINSHAKRAAAKLGRQVTAYNDAITGAVIADMDSQVTRLLAHSPDYVTMDIGANDVCTWTASDYQAKLQAYEQTLRTELARIIQALPNVKVMLAPVPNVATLYDVAVGQSGCQSKWDVIGMCKPLLDSSNTAADRAAFVERWKAINVTIETVAKEFPVNVMHDPSIADTPFAWGDVSTIDCFHPSVAGQNLLADKTWLLVDALGL